MLPYITVNVYLFRSDCWPRDAPVVGRRVGTSGGVLRDEELVPLAEHEASAASSDDLSADSCPDTSSKYHSCEAVETDDELRH